MWNFRGFWFLALKFLRVRCNKMFRYFQEWDLVLFEITKGRLTNLETPGVFSKKVCPKPHSFDFFWNNPLFAIISSKRKPLQKTIKKKPWPTRPLFWSFREEAVTLVSRLSTCGKNVTQKRSCWKHLDKRVHPVKTLSTMSPCSTSLTSGIVCMVGK